MANGQKLHHYMATTLVMYKREGDEVVKSRHMNMVITSNTKAITYHLIDQGRLSILERMKTELNVDPENIVDFVFISFSYLGLMSQDDFQGVEKQAKGKTNAYN